MKAATGLLCAAAAGAIWGALAIIIAGVTLALTAGVAARPSLLAGMAAGAIGASVFLIAPVKERTGGIMLASAAASIVGLILVAFAAPFGLPLEQATAAQTLAITAVAGSVLAANWITVQDVPIGSLTRYQLEQVSIRVLKGLGFVFFTVVVALPFYVMVMTSLKSQQALLANPLDLSLDLSRGISGLFVSYVELFTTFNFGRYLLVSAIVSVGTVILTLLFSIPGAYAVSRLRFPGRAVLSRSILLIYMVPAIVLVIPLYSVFSQAGLRNNLLGLLIVYPATTIPVALYMLQGYFRGLPQELEEAGLMDGLNRFGVIGKITLPLSLPALAAVALYVFMIAWNEFLFAFMFLDNPELFTLSRGIVSLNSSEVPRQHLMAGAVVATVPVLFIFLWFERFLVQGLTSGSVKG